jgi:hypothetical protein
MIAGVYQSDLDRPLLRLTRQPDSRHQPGIPGAQYHDLNLFFCHHITSFLNGWGKATGRTTSLPTENSLPIALPLLNRANEANDL